MGKDGKDGKGDRGVRFWYYVEDILLSSIKPGSNGSLSIFTPVGREPYEALQRHHLARRAVLRLCIAPS